MTIKNLNVSPKGVFNCNSSVVIAVFETFSGGGSCGCGSCGCGGGGN